MSQVNWRTINIDALDPDSAANFDLSTLTPGLVPASAADVQSLAGQIRQLLRGGDSEGALRGALEMAPYGGDEKAKDIHLATVMEIFQSIRQSEMTPLLTRIYQSDGGTELVDCLMKYIYKGMAQASPSSGSKGTMTRQATGGFSQIQGRVGAGEGSGHTMGVLLSWHEKLVEIAGVGCIVRVMTDRRTV
ncbi:Arp2/3 complex subunit Arc16 [Rhizodiscina lignyota]|uniref:Actin-related protein 2/3 complex subunit 5 n=1 Tax=Rhizodiscina lignyota TaxID=1504668 RepID=A0A9P4M8N7_9PEZI|nr:Arp2/3 complex subunit Arc16 [Rhizodiscina lignyota]